MPPNTSGLRKGHNRIRSSLSHAAIEVSGLSLQLSPASAILRKVALPLLLRPTVSRRYLAKGIVSFLTTDMSSSRGRDKNSIEGSNVTSAASGADESKLNVQNRLNPALFVAVLSSCDDTTPFWVGKILKYENNAQSTWQHATVRWYQASGSAVDPFDAIYTPAKRSQKLATDIGFWESSVALQDIITSFDSLTDDKRLTKQSIAQIKSKLYK